MCSFWTKSWSWQQRYYWRPCNHIQNFKIYQPNVQRSRKTPQYHWILYLHSKLSNTCLCSCRVWFHFQMSPDDAPVIDKHPQYDNIILAAGFSGINIIRNVYPCFANHRKSSWGTYWASEKECNINTPIRALGAAVGLLVSLRADIHNNAQPEVLQLTTLIIVPIWAPVCFTCGMFSLAEFWLQGIVDKRQKLIRISSDT